MSEPVIVVPILLGDQHSLVSHPDGPALLADLFRTLAESGPDCIAVGRENPALAVAARCGMETLNLALLPDDPALPMPPGTASALKALRRQGRIGADTPVLTVHCEAVRLTSNELASALESLREPGIGLAVTEPEHHPCQLYLYEHLLDVGVLTLLAPEFIGPLPGREAETVVTVPFHFDWEAFSPTTRPERWTAYSDTTAPGHGNGCGGHLLRVSDKRARFACVPHEKRNHVLGICLPCPEMGPFLRQGLDGPGIDFGNDALPKGTYRISARGHGDDGKAVGVQGTTYLAANSGLMPLPGEAFGPGVAQVAYTVTQTDGSTFDIRSPFPQSRKRWRFDHERGLMVNTATGEKITGRQQLPAVWRTSGTLAAGTAGDLEEAARRFPPTGLRPLRVDAHTGGLLVTGHYELLKAHSLRQDEKDDEQNRPD